MTEGIVHPFSYLALFQAKWSDSSPVIYVVVRYRRWSIGDIGFTILDSTVSPRGKWGTCFLFVTRRTACYHLLIYRVKVPRVWHPVSEIELVRRDAVRQNGNEE